MLMMLEKTGLSSSIVTNAFCTVGALGFLSTVITTVLVVRVKGRKLSYTAISNCGGDEKKANYCFNSRGTSCHALQSSSRTES